MASKAPIQMNCSGKHAAMLATCVTNGWPTETYLDADHPLQQAIAATFARTTGEPVAHVAVDGCGAPLLSTSLTGLARAFARLATGIVGTGSRSPRPSGRTRSTSRAPIATSSPCCAPIPGAIGKAGAESCYAVALPDGRAFATKTDDGAARARPVRDGGAARAARRDGGAGRGRRRGASYGRSGVARRRATSG